MKNAPDYRMLVYTKRSLQTFLMVDFAQQVGDEWLSLSFEKTAKQLSEEAVKAFALTLETTGAATYYGPVKLVSLAHGRRLYRAYYKASQQQAH